MRCYSESQRHAQSLPHLGLSKINVLAQHLLRKKRRTKEEENGRKKNGKERKKKRKKER
jgi:hypothetical protein